ncbi:thioesterase family protein [Hyphomicrobium sp.]|uniref:thioesterase family protein n=1 Tax=Hyphomicrobium sp. TaxID=82 RepID=UPI002D799DF1|nr:thioesterase family protein [Hyphomicrobium sp.]HET6389880.1 thioesterase family protein [Hyphomicrobium sp.]
MADLSALKVGLEGTASALVTEERLATNVGSGNVPVFASPMLLALMEAAAVNCLEGHLPEDYQSLGVQLNVAHTAPTPIGFTVTAKATLKAIEGRKLTFDVVANDGAEQIGSGVHTRIVVDTPRFMARLAAKSLPRP